MKDFDEARNARAAYDRTFKIGGETFAFRAAVAPETIMRWTEFATDGDRENMMLAAAQQRLNAAEKFDPPWSQNALAELQMKVADAAEAAVSKGKDERSWIQLIDETALAIIVPEDHEKWERVRNENVEFPLALNDLQELIEWLIEKVVGRPTEPPSDSSSLGGTTTALSTGDSSPQADTESPDLTTDEAVESEPSTPDSSPTSSTPS